MDNRPKSGSLPGFSEPRPQTRAETECSSSSSSSRATVLSGPAPPPAPSAPPETELLLPEAWKCSLPPEQHEWVSRALFVRGRTGRPVLSQELQLWYHPPGPQQVYKQPPSTPAAFFQRPFFLWAPYRMWQYRLKCPDCGQKLWSCGVYKTVRKVLDTDGWYYMATEYLECRRCRKKVTGWSDCVRKQLELHHQQLFPAVMAYKLSCDKKLLVLMEGGSSAHHLRAFLLQQHTAEWIRRGTHFLFTCRKFEAQSPPPAALPKMEAVPSSTWLLATYAKDSSSRISELKARLTSTFGSILKMNSTRTVVKKLGGANAGHAQFMTSVGNELGQVLMSVLTKTDSSELQHMACGLQERYQRAGQNPPQVLYVDRGCCRGDRGLSAVALFPTWPQMFIRLDVLCFLIRLARGVTLNRHLLYPEFMQRLSDCIFEWDQEDLSRLRTTGLLDQSRNRSSIKEMSRHCRRHTRGAQETERLIDELLETMMDAIDSRGVPLLDRDRMKEVWSSERKHVACIQDPPGVQLYTRTGQVTRGGVSLSVYRCARGLASLLSFYTYLSRFIPGTNISSCYFQMYLLEGLTRWNEARAQAGGNGTKCCSSQQQLHTFNQLTQHFYGLTLAQGVTQLQEYTGELIGVSYLKAQTGLTLQDFLEQPDITMATEGKDDVEEEFGDFLSPQPPPEAPPSFQCTPPSLTSGSQVSVGSNPTSISATATSTSKITTSTLKTAASTSKITTSTLATTTSTSAEATSTPPRATSTSKTTTSTSKTTPSTSATATSTSAAATSTPPAATSTSAPATSSPHRVPRTTAWRRRLKEEQQREAQEMGVPVKRQRKDTEHYLCRRCSRPKTKEFGHSRYGREHFCSEAEGRSVEDWLQERRSQGGARGPASVQRSSSLT